MFVCLFVLLFVVFVVVSSSPFVVVAVVVSSGFVLNVQTYASKARHLPSRGEECGAGQNDRGVRDT